MENARLNRDDATTKAIPGPWFGVQAGVGFVAGPLRAEERIIRCSWEAPAGSRVWDLSGPAWRVGDPRV